MKLSDAGITAGGLLSREVTIAWSDIDWIFPIEKVPYLGPLPFSALSSVDRLAIWSHQDQILASRLQVAWNDLLGLLADRASHAAHGFGLLPDVMVRRLERWLSSAPRSFEHETRIAKWCKAIDSLRQLAGGTLSSPHHAYLLKDLWHESRLDELFDLWVPGDLQGTGTGLLAEVAESREYGFLGLFRPVVGSATLLLPLDVKPKPGPVKEAYAKDNFSLSSLVAPRPLHVLKATMEDAVKHGGGSDEVGRIRTEWLRILDGEVERSRASTTQDRLAGALELRGEARATMGDGEGASSDLRASLGFLQTLGDGKGAKRIAKRIDKLTRPRPWWRFGS